MMPCVFIAWSYPEGRRASTPVGILLLYQREDESPMSDPYDDLFEAIRNQGSGEVDPGDEGPSCWEIQLGDCLDVMRTMDDASVDSIVTDPPYGLMFMGKNWDHGVPGVEFWKEALRVAKPGTHLVAFGGTRTHHRLMVAIEDAGWEIRDCTMWMFGSGFPKSLDVSKAIDRMDASEEQEQRRLRFTSWVRSTGVSPAQIDAATMSNMGRHYAAKKSQPLIMTKEHLEACRHLFREVPVWVEEETDIRSIESRNMAAREVMGLHANPAGNKVGGNSLNMSVMGMPETATLTAPATEAAKKWSGYGTAQKPAIEPVVLARKPLEGTVARNVLKYGTGALNIDGCRVEVSEQDAEEMDRCNTPGSGQFGGDNSLIYGGDDELTPTGEKMATSKGRWPANLIWDGSEEVKALFPQTGPGDSGSASRYFKVTPYGDDDLDILPQYCAKANKRDRDEGCEGMEERLSSSIPGRRDSDSVDWNHDNELTSRFTTSRRNFHPTVKPVNLMRYLCRLVTPPGGLVLDPFCGSGSTGKGALLEGFRFVGIEREPEYAEIARARCAHAAKRKS